LASGPHGAVAKKGEDKMTKNEAAEYIQSCAEDDGPSSYADAAAIFAALFGRLPDAEDGTAADLWSHCCAAAND
jgi:hypothetical protein